MKKKIDLDILSKEQYLDLVSYLRGEIVDRAFRATEELDYLKDLVESAIDWNYHNSVPSSLLTLAEDAATTLPSVEEEEARGEEDEFIVLKDPFMSRLFLAWFRIIKNKNLNPNNNWFGVNRSSSALLKKLNLRGFQEGLNKAIVQYFTKENKRYDFRKKYSKLIPEFVAHGYTCGLHTWNTKDNYCDIVAAGTRNFGIFPITDKLENTNKVFRYPVTYNTLINSTGFRYDSEFIKTYIRPSNNSTGDTYYSDVNRKENSPTETKRGQIIIHEIMIPSLFIEAKNPDETPVVAKDVYFKVIFEATTSQEFSRSGEEINFGSNDFVLEAYQDTETYETGELIETFNDTFPEDFPGKGPLIPFLYDQAHLNQLRQAHVRIVQNMADPPYSEETLDGIESEDTDTYRLLPGKVFNNKKIEILFPGEFVAAINNIIQAKKVITEDAENSQGLNRNRQGQPLPGKRSATEVEIIDSESSDAVFDVITQFDNVLRSSMGIRIRRTQEEIANIVAEVDIDQEELIEKILSESPLFQKIIEWSGIEVAYEQYFEQYQRELADEEELDYQIQRLSKRIAQIEDTILTPSRAADAEQLAMEQQQEAQLEQEREQLISQVSAMVKSKKNLQPIPDPSNYLYFLMWTDFINTSDIDVVAGTAASRVKEEMDIYNTMLEYSQNIPEIRAITDFEKIFDNLAKMMKKSKEDFLISAPERVKVEQELKQIRQQVLMQMAMQEAQEAQQGK